jgi:signal transduction histidine kinase
LQLATARDHALAAAKLKAEFAANVSHEIRTPLNGILGTLNLLGDTVLNRDQKELITLAESSSEALMILINDILDFSRLSLDQAELSNIEFDLYQLLEELMFLHGQSGYFN